MTAIDELPPEETMEMLGGPLDGMVQPIEWNGEGPAQIVGIFTAPRPSDGSDVDLTTAKLDVAEYQLFGLHTVSRRWIYVPHR